MRNNLYKLYSALSPLERLKLVMMALARGDEKEQERLVSSCPRHNYVMNDLAFTRLAQASYRICQVFVLLWQEALGRVRMAEACYEGYLEAVGSFSRGFVEGANFAWEKAGQQGKLLGDELADMNEMGAMIRQNVLLELLHRRIGELKGVQLGLEQFCRATGLDMEHILAWFPPVKGYIEGAGEYLVSEIEASQETAGEVCGLFLKMWPGLEVEVS